MLVYAIVSGKRRNRTAQVLFDVGKVEEISILNNETQDLENSGEDSEYQDHEHVEVSESDQLLDAIKTTITNLFRLSVLVRAATSRDRYMRAAARSSHEDAFDGKFDIDHVRAKFPSLEQKAPWLVLRLGAAITLRREYLRYCQEHSQVLKSSGGEELIDTTNTNTQLDIEVTQAEANKQTRSIVEIEPSLNQQTSASTFLDASLNVSNPTSDDMVDDDIQSMTTYTTSRGGDLSEEKLRVISLDDVAKGSQYFECPYCCHLKEIKVQKAWR